MSPQKPASKKPRPRPSRARRATTAPNQPPPPDAERDEIAATMHDLREHNPSMFNALMTVLRLDAPARSAALKLIGAARAAMPVPPPQPTRPLVQEALLLFAEITDPANKWATTAEAVAGTLDLVLDRIALGDRASAGLVLASALEHAADDELRDVVDSLKRDRDNMHASIRERAGRAS